MNISYFVNSYIRIMSFGVKPNLLSSKCATMDSWLKIHKFHKWIIGKCFDLEQGPHAILLLPCKHFVVWRLFLLKKNWRGKNLLKYAPLLCNQKLSWNSTSRDNVLSKLALSAELTTAVDLNFYNSVHHEFVRALCGLKKFKLQIKLASELKIPFMNHFS